MINRPIFYIDESTLPRYRNGLLADISQCSTSVEALLTKHKIELPHNCNHDKESISQYVNVTCDDLARNMQCLDNLIGKIKYIKDYLAQNNITNASEHLANITRSITGLLDNKTLLCNEIVSPVRFNQITYTLTQYKLWLAQANEKLATLIKSPKIEIAIVFSMENQIDNASHLRNIIRHSLLKYCAKHRHSMYRTCMRKILVKLPACTDTSSAVTIIQNELHYTNVFFGVNLLRNTILKEISDYRHHMNINLPKVSGR